MSRLTWPTVALTAIIGFLAVALAWLAKWSAGEVTAVVAVLAGISGGVVAGNAVAGGVQQRVDELQAETSAQSSTLAVLDRRTNGELDARIAAASREAAELVLTELREQGVIR